jgi:hypothetical protein
MAAIPFRRKPSKTERYLAYAQPALDLAQNGANAVARQARKVNAKLLAVGGAIAAAGTAALLKRERIAGLLRSRSSDQTARSPIPTPPQPSNYDAPGPVANTATPIPAPDSQTPAAIDEEAEEAAAAAEAGAIGGDPSDYAGSELGEPADEAERPLAEAGQGEAEGQEQAEAELVDNATTRGTGMTDAERQIEDTIDQAGQPQSGEKPEPLASPPTDTSDDPKDVVPPGEAGEDGAPGGGISGRPYAGLEHKDGEADVETKETPAAAGESGARDDDSTS